MIVDCYTAWIALIERNPVESSLEKRSCRTREINVIDNIRTQIGVIHNIGPKF